MEIKMNLTERQKEIAKKMVEDHYDNSPLNAGTKSPIFQAIKKRDSYHLLPITVLGTEEMEGEDLVFQEPHYYGRLGTRKFDSEVEYILAANPGLDSEDVISYQQYVESLTILQEGTPGDYFDKYDVETPKVYLWLVSTSVEETFFVKERAERYVKEEMKGSGYVFTEATWRDEADITHVRELLETIGNNLKEGVEK